MKHFSPKKILIWVMFLILFYTIFTYYSDLEKIQNHLANVSVVYFIPLFCILIAMSMSIYLRTMPLHMPITDQWAEDTVMNFYQTQVSNQINLSIIFLN